MIVSRMIEDEIVNLQPPQGFDRFIYEKQMALWTGRFFADHERAEAAASCRSGARLDARSWRLRSNQALCGRDA
jgi:hypothetical protein